MTHVELDCKQLLCPMPVIKVQQQLAELQPGDTLRVHCTDPGTLHDIPAWCRVHGHELVSSIQHGPRSIEITIMCKDAQPDQ